MIKKISIYNLGTHQGRLKEPGKESTNGCTVISALVAQNHLKTGPAIPNSKIESVIDIDAPPILRKVRVKLGLTGDALIIPSDVNDYFVDNNMLKPPCFSCSVAGGINRVFGSLSLLLFAYCYWIFLSLLVHT